MTVPSLNAILADPLVTEARHRGGVLTTGNWTLRLPRLFGFCGGVMQALERLQQALREDGNEHRFWLLGEIIHNETVNRYFVAQGVTLLSDAESAQVLTLTRPGDRIVIPVFGIPLELEQNLRAAETAAKVVVVDTACRYVRRIWEFVSLQAAAGRTLILHGKPEHPEMRATISRALGPDNAVILVPDEAAIAAVTALLAGHQPAEAEFRLLQPGKLDRRRLALAHQTTLMHETAIRIEHTLREVVKDNGGSLEVLDTVCRATQERQAAAEELCLAGCDLYLIIGGSSSSNTTQLHRLASRYAPSYFIRDPAALAAEQIRHFVPATGREEVTPGWLPPRARIGILAGASCPPCDIGGVLRRFCTFAGVAPPSG